MGVNLNILDTEKRNINSENIDLMNTHDILQTINNEDKKVAYAVEKVIPEVEKLVDSAYKKMCAGGRLIYIGAGTSGRLGVLDASECPPTYGVEPELVQGIIAGGFGALLKAKEGAEDSITLGEEDLKKVNLSQNDIVIGLAASGRTPYVIGGLDYAAKVGALTGSVSCVSNSKISAHAEYPIEVIVGPEVITGSTRMKSGTAQKLILNMVSTSLMIKKGKVYHNLMVDVQPTNEKLVSRAKNIIISCTGCTMKEAEKYLNISEMNVKTAILMILTGNDKDSCNEMLTKEHENISSAIRTFNNK